MSDTSLLEPADWDAVRRGPGPHTRRILDRLGIPVPKDPTQWQAWYTELWQRTGATSGSGQELTEVAPGLARLTSAMGCGGPVHEFAFSPDEVAELAPFDRAFAQSQRGGVYRPGASREEVLQRRAIRAQHELREALDQETALRAVRDLGQWRELQQRAHGDAPGGARDAQDL